jgi:hypothetical protein
MSTTSRDLTRRRWWLPAVSLGLGAVMLAAFAIGGDTAGGLQSFGVMAAVAALFAFGASRSETLGGLGGPGRDERWAMIDLRASALAGFVLIVVVIGAFLYEIASGEDGEPYSQLGAIAGVAYIAALALLRARS